jgi:hypothetical protein
LAAGRIQKERDALYRRNVSLEKYVLTSEKAHEITNAIRNCNLLFNRLTKVNLLLREDIQAISGLHRPCEDENDFIVKIGALAGLFEVGLDEIKSRLMNWEKGWKLVKLLERWFDENNISYDRGMLETWRKIIELRNASFPYHPTDTRVIDLLRFFGHDFPIRYPQLWDSILDKFRNSLISLQIALNSALSSGMRLWNQTASSQT